MEEEIELKVSKADIALIGWALEVGVSALVAKSHSDEKFDGESSVEMIQRLTDVSNKISEQAEEVIQL